MSLGPQISAGPPQHCFIRCPQLRASWGRPSDASPCTLLTVLTLLPFRNAQARERRFPRALLTLVPTEGTGARAQRRRAVKTGRHN